MARLVHAYGLVTFLVLLRNESNRHDVGRSELGIGVFEYSPILEETTISDCENSCCSRFGWRGCGAVFARPHGKEKGPNNELSECLIPRDGAVVIEFVNLLNNRDWDGFLSAIVIITCLETREEPTQAYCCVIGCVESWIWNMVFHEGLSQDTDGIAD